MSNVNPSLVQYGSMFQAIQNADSQLFSFSVPSKSLSGTVTQNDTFVLPHTNEIGIVRMRYSNQSKWTLGPFVSYNDPGNLFDIITVLQWTSSGLQANTRWNKDTSGGPYTTPALTCYIQIALFLPPW